MYHIAPIKNCFSSEMRKDANYGFYGRIKINCECCQKNQNEYLFLDCKRNICKDCWKYHKSHKLYQSNEY